MNTYNEQLYKYLKKQNDLRKNLENPINNLIQNHPANKYAEFYASINSQFNIPVIQNAKIINDQFRFTLENPLKNVREQLQRVTESPLKIIHEQQEELKSMISKINSIYNQDFYAKMKIPINEIDVKKSTEILENKISNLSNKDELSSEEKLDIIEALIFISDQEGENPDDFIKSFRSEIRSFIDSKEKISEKINDVPSETDNTKDEEKISNHELPPSFIEDLFSKKTFQEQAISIIYATFFSYISSVISGILDPLTFLIIITIFIGIFSNNDK